MQDLAIKALDQDLAAEFQKDPNPVALQAALLIQVIREIQRAGLPTAAQVMAKRDAMMANLEAQKPQPNPPGHKKGKGH